MSDIFEFATRNKVRFQLRGQLSVEDLWDLRQTQLNEIFQGIQARRQSRAESLIVQESEEDVLLGIQSDIVRHIFNTRKAEAEAKEQALARREEKRRLQELLAQKREQGLSALSEEELQARIDAL